MKHLLINKWYAPDSIVGARGVMVNRTYVIYIFKNNNLDFD